MNKLNKQVVSNEELPKDDNEDIITSSYPLSEYDKGNEYGEEVEEDDDDERDEDDYEEDDDEDDDDEEDDEDDEVNSISAHQFAFENMMTGISVS